MYNLKKTLKNEVFCYIAAFTVPIMILMCVYYFNNIFPFGDNTLLTNDMSQQYVAFLSYFKSVLKGESSAIYTFAKTLGGDMQGFVAYYILSPVNLILLFFQTAYINEGILVLTLIKIGLCGLTFFLFLFKGKKEKNLLTGIFFSTAYALCMYNIVYQQNIMWLDGVAILPLMIMGIDMLREKKKIYLYVITIALGIVTNYYIGFMLCVFSLIYYLFSLVNMTKVKKICFKNVTRYILASMLGIGISAVVLLPALFSLQGGKAEFSLSQFSFNLNFSFLQFIAKHLTGAFEFQELVTGLPNVFVGVVVLFFSILYFENSEIEIREKLCHGGILLTLFLSFVITPINLIWHGFNNPVCFVYRYSFIYSFMLIYLAYLSFKKIPNGLSMTKIIMTLTLVVAVAIAVALKDFSFVSKKMLVFDGIFIIVLGILIIKDIKEKRKAKNILVCFLVLFSFIDLGVNAIVVFKQLTFDNYTDFQKYVQDVEPIIDEIKQKDNSFFRLEKNFPRYNRNDEVNDSMLFNYKGLSHFSSSEKLRTKEFMGALGYRYDVYRAAYGKDGATLFLDSILGMKYLLSKDNVNLGKNSYLNYDGIVNNINVYTNPYALSVGYVTNRQVLQVPENHLNNNEQNVFEYQNEIACAMTGDTSRMLFEPLVYVEESHEKESTEYIIHTDSTGPVYAYFDGNSITPSSIKINGLDLGNYFDFSQEGIIYLGDFESGTNINLVLSSNSETKLTYNNIFFYQMDINVFQSDIDILKREQFKIEKYTDSKFKGKIQIKQDNQGVFFTVPYDEGWKIKVDNKEIQGKVAFDTFVYVPLNEGEYEIELVFEPRGLKLGTIISIFSTLCLLVLWKLRKI